jgi:hypothetical protein
LEKFNGVKPENQAASMQWRLRAATHAVRTIGQVALG